MVKATFWDFNGVVIADTWVNYEADLETIAHFGGRHHTLTEHRATATIPSARFYLAHGCSEQDVTERKTELGEVFHRAYEKRVNRCRSRRGLRETLMFLKRRSVPAVIFSNHTTDSIRAQLVRLRLVEYFERIYAYGEKSGSVSLGSKAEWVAKHFEGLKLKPREVLIIGDSPEETRIGKEHGFVTVAITDGEYDTARLRQAKPDHLIHRVSQVVPIIRNLERM